MNASFDDRDPRVVYQPSESWFMSGVVPQAFAGTFMFSEDINASVIFTFPIPATAVYWQGFKQSDGGAYEVCLDCSPEDENEGYITVDGHDDNAQPSDPPSVLFSLTGLSNSVHKLVIRNRPDPRFGNLSTITVDSFTLTTSSNVPISATTLRPLPSTLTPAASPSPTNNNGTVASVGANTKISSATERLIIGVVLGVICLLACLLVGLYFWWSRRLARLYGRLNILPDGKPPGPRVLYVTPASIRERFFTNKLNTEASPLTANSETLVHASPPRMALRTPSPPPKDWVVLEDQDFSVTRQQSFRPPVPPKDSSWLTIAKTINPGNNPLNDMGRPSLSPSDAHSMTSSTMAGRVSISGMSSAQSERNLDNALQLTNERPSLELHNFQATRSLSIPRKMPASVQFSNLPMSQYQIPATSTSDIQVLRDTTSMSVAQEQGKPTEEQTSEDSGVQQNRSLNNLGTSNTQAQLLPGILTPGTPSTTSSSSRLPPEKSTSYRASPADFALVRRMWPSDLPTVDTGISSYTSTPGINQGSSNQPFSNGADAGHSLVVPQTPLTPSILRTVQSVQTGDLVRTPTNFTVRSTGASFFGSRSSTPFTNEGSVTSSSAKLGANNPFANLMSRSSTLDEVAYFPIPASRTQPHWQHDLATAAYRSMNAYDGPISRVSSPAQSLSPSVEPTRFGRMYDRMPALLEESDQSRYSASSYQRSSGGMEKALNNSGESLPSILRPGSYASEPDRNSTRKDS
ncbi:hypothetical protein M422DRAFT_778185 [Sphaerobolus stellatus SS14]|nr:hypothetical protein M422DRAFT_778185 [Sphaerobolus stellatus SS14]